MCNKNKRDSTVNLITDEIQSALQCSRESQRQQKEIKTLIFEKTSVSLGSEQIFGHYSILEADLIENKNRTTKEIQNDPSKVFLLQYHQYRKNYFSKSISFLLITQIFQLNIFFCERIIWITSKTIWKIKTTAHNLGRIAEILPIYFAVLATKTSSEDVSVVKTLTAYIYQIEFV